MESERHHGPPSERSEWLGLTRIEWRDPALDPDLAVAFARFFAPDGAVGYDVYTSPERSAWYQIAPTGKGWDLLAFLHGDGEPYLNLTDTSPLAAIKDNPMEYAVCDLIAVVAVLVVEREDPTILAVPPGLWDVAHLEQLRRRWHRWARRVPAQLRLQVRGAEEQGVTE